jgi:hypothetical protein
VTLRSTATEALYRFSQQGFIGNFDGGKHAMFRKLTFQFLF